MSCYKPHTMFAAGHIEPARKTQPIDATPPCEHCDGAGVVMVHTGNRQREDTRGYEEETCICMRTNGNR